MSWDYAELSKAAKDAGGPEKLMDMLVDSGKDIGHKDMLPVVGIALGVGALSYAGISKLVKYFKSKKNSPDEIEKARHTLIEGIKKYDAEHPENEETDNNDESNPSD